MCLRHVAEEKQVLNYLMSIGYWLLIGMLVVSVILNFLLVCFIGKQHLALENIKMILWMKL